MNTKFSDKLDELKNEFPDHYIEVWTPEDFKEYFNEITEEQCIEWININGDATKYTIVKE